MSLSRTDRILALAWSLPDALRVLTSTSSEARRLAPAQWALCAPCDGTGETRDRWGTTSKCGVCGGAGRYRSDPYADGPVSGADDPAPGRVTSRRIQCDRCSLGVIPARWLVDGASGLVACPTCEGTGHLEIPIGDTADAAVRTGAASVTWAISGGDWGELDASLERMRCNGRRPLWRAFVAAYVEPPYTVTDAARDGLEQVSLMMPPRVRVPADVVTAWQQRDARARLSQAERVKRVGRSHRNRSIREALKLGHTVEDVARMFAVSDRTVRRLG